MISIFIYIIYIYITNCNSFLILDIWSLELKFQRLELTLTQSNEHGVKYEVSGGKTERTLMGLGFYKFDSLNILTIKYIIIITINYLFFLIKKNN